MRNVLEEEKSKGQSKLVLKSIKEKFFLLGTYSQEISESMLKLEKLTQKLVICQNSAISYMIGESDF